MGDFTTEAHQQIFAALASLYREGKPADLVLVCDRLKLRGELEPVGGESYLTALLEAAPTAAAVEYYAQLVQEATVRRQDGPAGARGLGRPASRRRGRWLRRWSTFRGRWEKLGAGLEEDALRSLGEILAEGWDELGLRAAAQEAYSTGLGELDRIIGGLHPG